MVWVWRPFSKPIIYVNCSNPIWHSLSVTIGNIQRIFRSATCRRTIGFIVCTPEADCKVCFHKKPCKCSFKTQIIERTRVVIRYRNMIITIQCNGIIKKVFYKPKSVCIWCNSSRYKRFWVQFIRQGFVPNPYCYGIAIHVTKRWTSYNKQWNTHYFETISYFISLSKASDISQTLIAIINRNCISIYTA